MSDTAAPFHYDIVGSFLRPEKLKTARAQFAEGAISHDELEAVENEAIKELVAQQKAAGLHAVTDGEFRRSMWHLDFLTELLGCEEVGRSIGRSTSRAISRNRRPSSLPTRLTSVNTPS